MAPFDEMLRSGLSRPKRRRHRALDVDQGTSACGMFLGIGPESIHTEGLQHPCLCREGTVVQPRLMPLITPYFVLHERGIELLCDLTRRGVRVRVLTNSLASTDVAAVHAGYARYRPRLLACGVSLHEMQPWLWRAGADGDRAASRQGRDRLAAEPDARALLAHPARTGGCRAGDT